MRKLISVKFYVSFFVLYCISINFSAQLAFSQSLTETPTTTPTPTPTPINPVLQKLKDDNAILEEQKKSIDLKNSMLQIPKPATTPPAGNIEIDSGVKIESEMMAYRALKSVADKVSEEVKLKRGKATSLAILNNQWLSGIKSYWATKNQMKLMNDGYDRILVPIQLPTLRASETESGLMARILGMETGSSVGDKSSLKNFKVELLEELKKSNFAIKITDLSENMALVEKTSEGASDADGDVPFGTFTAIGSAIGIAGSIVGAFIDVAALMRTDTKITGSSFAVQESALVSEVYRGLKDDSGFTNLYYPAEFSPNVNLRSDFVILKDIQELYEKKSRAEQIVTEIEETDKAYKEAITAKEALEARKKQLPDLIASAERELKKNQSIYKTPKFRSAELLAKIKDGENSIADLKKERDVTLPKKIETNKNAIAVLDVKLTRLYEQIKTVKPEINLVRAYSVVAANIDDVSNELLRRAYTLEELEKLSVGEDKVTKEKLIKEAKSKGELSAADEDRLINPIESERLKIFIKVANKIKNNPKLFIQPVLNDLLSDEEQLKLFYPLDEQVVVAKKILEKSKTSSVNQLKVLIKQFDKFFEDIVKVDATSGVNLITAHLQTENLLNALGCDMVTGACDTANALVLKVIDVGGNNKVKKNLVTMVATGDAVSHSGGAIIEYKMYNLYGNVLTSSVCSAYEPYLKARNIKVSSKMSDNVVCSAPPSDENQDEDKDNDDSKIGKKQRKTKTNASLVKN
ncbi:MAG: hypothetical protein JWO69_1904 [Thermoleophilia bacterium]|nr:hypothetical protein [Thermoleophilia bacterium]